MQILVYGHKGPAQPTKPLIQLRSTIANCLIAAFLSFMFAKRMYFHNIAALCFIWNHLTLPLLIQLKGEFKNLNSL